MNGEKKNIHFPHWTESMSWIRFLLINQTYEKDLTLAIEPDSLRSVSTIGCWGIFRISDRLASRISISFKFAHHSNADLLNTVGKERGFGYAKIA